MSVIVRSEAVVNASLPQSIRYCRRLAKQSGSNFYYAFFTLPPSMFQEMCVLYAFMRHTDNLGDDESVSLEERRAAISRWREQLEEALAGSPPGTILPALVDVVTRRSIPSRYLFDVIDGVESDLNPRVFQTYDELKQYCYQVAGAVGLCCLHMWGFDDSEESRRQGIACGRAFQLTNILRDLAEDAERGRIYLPRKDLERFEYPPANLRQRVINRQFRELMAFQVERAWQDHHAARGLLDTLPPHGRRIQSALIAVYGELLKEIERHDYNVFSKRLQLSRWKKLRVLMQCCFGRAIR